MEIKDVSCAQAGAVGIGGGVVTLLAHVALPVVVAPGMGSMTATGLVSQLGIEGSMSAAPLFALLAAGTGLWLFLMKPAPELARWGGYGLLTCAGLTALSYLASVPQILNVIALPDLSEIGAFLAFIGPGCYLISLGIAAQAIGGVLVFVAGRSEPPIRSDPSTGP